MKSLDASSRASPEIKSLGTILAQDSPPSQSHHPPGTVLERKGWRAVEGQAGTNIAQAQIYRERHGSNGFGVTHTSAAPHRAGAGPKGMPIEKFGFSMPARQGVSLDFTVGD